MANHKSASKQYLVSLKKAKRNKSVKTRIKTYIKKVKNAIAAKDYLAANLALRMVDSEIMKGVKQNVLKLNTGARKVSRLAIMIKKINVTQVNA